MMIDTTKRDYPFDVMYQRAPYYEPTLRKARLTKTKVCIRCNEMSEQRFSLKTGMPSPRPRGLQAIGCARVLLRDPRTAPEVKEAHEALSVEANKRINHQDRP